MEPKKNPKKDVHRYSGQLFLLSLGISIALAIVAFEWTTSFMIVNEPQPPRDPGEPFVLSYIPITAQVPDLPKPQKVIQQIDLSKVDETTDEPASTENPTIEEAPVSTNDIVQIQMPEVTKEIAPDVPFSVVEHMPEPVGGYEMFYAVLRKNIRYPRVAQRSNTEGKVQVQFTVNETGELSDFNVVKSLGAGCDEEAIRVLKLTKWLPGKQRGRAVKVYMVQTIYFALN